MNWLELKEGLIGGGTIYLIACSPFERAYLVKKWLQENKPHVNVMYSGEVSKVKLYQAQHWVEIHHTTKARNYTNGKFELGVMESLYSALQVIENKYKYKPSEIVLVRAWNVQKT